MADASLQRSAAEKYRDDQELVAARRREQARYTSRPPPGRHSRFGGTYILQNVKSISDKDIICHQSIERAFAMDFDRDKNKQKRSHRIVKEQASTERRSAYSIRCINVLMVARYGAAVQPLLGVLLGSYGRHNENKKKNHQQK